MTACKCAILQQDEVLLDNKLCDLVVRGAVAKEHCCQGGVNVCHFPEEGTKQADTMLYVDSRLQFESLAFTVKTTSQRKSTSWTYNNM